MTSRTLLTSSLLLLAGCTKVTSIDRFDTKVRITDYEMAYSDKEHPMGEVSCMEVFGDILIVDETNRDYLFSFIDLRKGRFITDWGMVGRGANEYLMTTQRFSTLDSMIVFSDMAARELNRVSIPDIIDKNNAPNITKEKYPYEVGFRPMEIQIVGDKKIAVGSFEKSHFGVLDSRNNIVENLSTPPFEYDNIGGLDRGSIFQMIMKSNPSRHRFVLMTLASDVFEIYEVTGNGVSKVYTSPFNHIPRIHEKPRGNTRYAIDWDNTMIGLTDVAVSDELICFKYSEENYTDGANTTSDEILCFNWDGEKVKKYILPFPVAKFCLDDTYIYGIAYEGDNQCVYRFKMN